MYQNKKIILTAFIISTLLMISKFVAYLLTNSNAVLTDALESIINVIAAGFAFYSISISNKPKDIDHPYGHGKIEFFSEGLEGVLICLASLYIVIDSIQHLFVPHVINQLGVGLGVLVFGILTNYFLGSYLLKNGLKNNSPTLKADGKHLKLDAQSGLILMISVGIMTFTHWIWLDAVASIIFSVWMFVAGIKLIRQAVGGLMDEVDANVLEKVVEILKFSKQSYWIDIHNLRIQKYGADLHIDAHLTLPKYWNLEQVHEAVHELENTLKDQFNGHVEIFIHSDPCLPVCCTHCKVENCPIRSNPQSQEIEWNIQNLTLNQKHIVFIES